MKQIFTLVLLLSFLISFSQWKRVEQLPSTDIASLYHKDSILYAGGKSKVYFSRDKGETWDSTNVIPASSFVDNIIVYKNELYVTSYSKGVYKSSDGGTSWQNITAGILPAVSDFTEWRGDLYAATLGSSVFKLDPVRCDRWLNFSNNLGNISANATTIAGTNNALVAGILANGLYNYLPANSTTWEERFLLGQIRPSEGAYDIITVHDTLFWAGHTGRSYMSTDNGLNWSLFGNVLPSLNSTFVNAKQALFLSRDIFDGEKFNAFYSYIKKDALPGQFTPFSAVTDHYTYKLEIAGDRLWDASTRGLFYMSLSEFPGISSADDEVVPVTLPVRFTLFNINCEGNKVLLTWKTEQEQNSQHYDIERSVNGINWITIGSLPATGSSVMENSYSFTDNNPAQNSVYRIVHTDKNGALEYTNTLQSSCNTTDVFNLWPNPTRDRVSINIVTGSESAAIIRIFDSKGALVRSQKVNISQGSNQISADMHLLANGIYTLSVEWNNGQLKKAVQVIKQ